MDLLGRKLAMKDGKLFRDFIDEIRQVVATAKQVEGVKAIAARVEKAVDKLEKTAKAIGERAKSKDVMNAYSFAHPFLEMTGDVAMAWMLLWRAMVAAPKLAKKAGSLDPEVVAAKAAANKDAAYYAGQVMTATFFINTLLPSALAKMDAIVEADSSVETMPEAAFGSK